MRFLATASSGPARSPISPRLEMGAYEALWLKSGATFKNIAEKFASDPDALPSDFVPRADAEACASEVMTLLKKRGVDRFGVRIHHAGDYARTSPWTSRLMSARLSFKRSQRMRRTRATFARLSLIFSTSMR